MIHELLICSTQNILQPIVNSLSSLENVLLKYIDHSGEYVVTTQSRKHCSFCRYIRSNYNGEKKCNDSARQVAFMAKEKQQPILTKCHAGLTLVAVPINVAGKHIGAIGFGEIKEIKEDANGEIASKTSVLGLNNEKIIELYENIPVLTRDHVLKIAETLYIISNYFIEMGITLARVNNDHAFLNEYLANPKDHFMSIDAIYNNKDMPPLRMKKAIRIAEKYIIRNYNKSISLKNVANFLHINPSYFSYLFKQVTGYNFKNYVTRLRIEKAKELLLNSSLTINQISQEIGYEDSNYFCRVFKKATGHSPSSYLKG